MTFLRIPCCLLLASATLGAQAPATLGGHPLRRGPGGELLPWAPWTEILEREMAFYARCPSDRGYPRFATATFLDGAWKPMPERPDSIPATQNGMGILSYLKYRAWRGDRDPRPLAVARAMGDYLLREARTPMEGAWPGFVRSTGRHDRFPQPPDCGTQSDRPFEIQPDKGGIAGFALAELAGATGDARYLEGALHLARVLARNQGPGDGTRSPFPFRADYRTGEGRGPVSGNMTYVLRLYDALLARGHREFEAPRGQLWRWIKAWQIPSAGGDGVLFAQFFEDHDTPTNRTAWAPLNLARLLLERREALDPDWLADAAALIGFVRRTFTHVEAGVRVCHEQDEDAQAWGGVNTTYGAVLALYAKASGSEALAREAREALTFALYAVDGQGRPRDLPSSAVPGGWQEDAHTDVIHNLVDALGAYPAWGRRERSNSTTRGASASSKAAPTRTDREP
ncbi:MAG TPA: hypothetical protein VK188_12405 [Holophaga sp.]|nr:hypothetical protein [Holophaga sp.]